MVRFALLFCAAALLAHAGVGIRILLGVGDSASSDWSGEVSAQSARIASVEPWRLDGDDALQPGNRWKMSTHNIRLFGGGALAVPRPVVANGVLVLLDNRITQQRYGQVFFDSLPDYGFSMEFDDVEKFFKAGLF